MSVHFKNRGVAVEVEVRNGPLVVCEARCLKASHNWVVDNIESDPEFRGQGYAQELIEAVVSLSGFPVHAFAIKPDALGFWEKMKNRNLYEQTSP